MKIFLITSGIALVIFLAFQVTMFMASKKSESQPYQVVREDNEFQIRYYPASIQAKIKSGSRSYREVGYSGFGKLATYIFGGNVGKVQIGMTSPVHIEIGDSASTMAFVMPGTFNRDNLPRPTNAEIMIEDVEAGFMASVQFGGFATASRIEHQKKALQLYLHENGFSHYGHFKLLGYNPPYQILGRRNEVIVAIQEKSLYK